MTPPTHAADAPVPQAGTEQAAADQAASQVSQSQTEQPGAGDAVGAVVGTAIDIVFSILDS